MKTFKRIIKMKTFQSEITHHFFTEEEVIKALIFFYNLASKSYRLRRTECEYILSVDEKKN
jgi:hypothetical protein